MDGQAIGRFAGAAIPATMILAMLGLFCALAAMGASGAVKQQHERPRPTPELMAPTPKPTDGSRVSYALIEAPYVGQGW